MVVIGPNFSYTDYEEVKKLYRKLEDVALKFGCKFAFGKMFFISPETFRKIYGDDLIKLKELAWKHDPTGKF